MPQNSELYANIKSVADTAYADKIGKRGFLIHI